MESRQLGSAGPDMSTVGLGCNNFGMKLNEEQAMSVVQAALEVGVTHFDTAEQYGGGVSETLLGRALGKRRSDVVIATKFSPRHDDVFRPGDLARRITLACESSLRRLSTDYIDVYYQHYVDPDAPLEELFEAFAHLVSDGKVRHVAASNADFAYLARCQAVDIPVSFCGLQTEWSLLARTAEESLVPGAIAAGMGVIPYFPLASGLLTGKYQRGEAYPSGSRLATMSWAGSVATDENFERVDLLARFAQERGRTLLELAFGWLLSQHGVTSVIAGATSAEQIQANAAASHWRLAADEMAAVAALLDAKDPVA